MFSFNKQQARLQQQKSRRDRFDASKHKLRPQLPVRPQESRGALSQETENSLFKKKRKVSSHNFTLFCCFISVKFKVDKKVSTRRRPPHPPPEKPDPSLNGEADVKTAWEQRSERNGAPQKDDDQLSQDGLINKDGGDGSSVGGDGGDTGTGE